jgi:hypothetical protein
MRSFLLLTLIAVCGCAKPIEPVIPTKPAPVDNSDIEQIRDEALGNIKTIEQSYQAAVDSGDYLAAADNMCRIAKLNGEATENAVLQAFREVVQHQHPDWSRSQCDEAAFDEHKKRATECRQLIEKYK